MLPSTKQQLLRLAQEELAQRLLLIKYQKKPLLWLKERFGEDPKSFAWSLWGGAYESHKWDGTKDPLAAIWQAVADNKWAGLESATGTGKTYALARIVFWFLDVFPNSLVVTSATVATQLKEQLWAEMKTAFHKFKKIRPHAYLFDSLRLLVDARGFDELGDEDQNLQAWGAIGVASRASSGSQANVSRQGFHREHMLIIVEEATGIDFPTLESYKNTCTGDHNVMLLVGNPDSQVDPLHQFCQSANVFAARASGYDHPNVVLQKEYVPGAVTTGSIERRRTDVGETSNLYQSRVRGISPSQGVDSLIRLDWIQASVRRETDATGVGALGVDVANSEAGDKGAVAFGKGNKLLYLKDFQCPNATHLAYNLVYDEVELTEKGYSIYSLPTLKSYGVQPNRVGVDGVGVGVSTINAFNDILPHKVISLQGGQMKEVLPHDDEGKPLYQFTSLRAQMYWELREDFRQGKIELAFNDSATYKQLVRELVTPKFQSKSGKIEVEGKDSIKKRLGNSPNLADAVAYWNWVRKGHYQAQDTILDEIEIDILT